jgi:hypothetical protein
MSDQTYHIHPKFREHYDALQCTFNSDTLFHRINFINSPASSVAKSKIEEFLSNTKVTGIQAISFLDSEAGTLPAIAAKASAHASWAAEVARKLLPKSVVIELSCLEFKGVREEERKRCLLTLLAGIMHHLIPFASPDSAVLNSARFRESVVTTQYSDKSLCSRSELVKEILFELRPLQVVLIVGNIEVFQVCEIEFELLNMKLFRAIQDKCFKALFVLAGREPQPGFPLRDIVYLDVYLQDGKLEQPKAKPISGLPWRR